jgi:rubrerythrin
VLERPRVAATLDLVSDHRCDRCGYQIATPPPLPRCPMCGIQDWKRIAAVRQWDIQAASM